MEYASFHYLMHKVPEQQKAFYVSGPAPLTFNELYSPRDRILVLKKEISYWRTRDRIEYCLYEDRFHKVLIITCYNIDKKETYRTIFVDLEKLFYEVESKARDSKELLTIKSNKKLSDDATLHKLVGDYIIARLSIKADPLPWPSEQVAPQPTIEAQTLATAVPIETNDMTSTVGPMERQCTLEKLSSDEYTTIEISKPTASTFLLDIPNVKLEPTVAIQVTEQQQQVDPSIVDTSKEKTETIATVETETAKTTNEKPNTKMKVAIAVVKATTKGAKAISQKKIAPSG